MRFFLFLASFIVILSARVEAQIDPSSAMLLNSGPRANVRDNGLDSGRYTVRPRSEVVHHDERIATPHKDVKPAPPTAATPAPAPVAVTESQNGEAGTDDVTDDQADEPAAAKVSIDDRRRTMLEISIAPGYLYSESKSTFAPRNYFLNAPVMNIDARVWVSSGFGLHTSFLGSLNGSISDSLDNTKNASASDQWFSVGAQSRHFFGVGSLAPMLRLGLDYREFQFRVPSDSIFRNKLATSGLFLLLDAEVPTSGFGSWAFGGEFGPKLRHSETSAATEFRTGDEAQTTSVGVHVGARYRFDSTQSVFWKVSYGVEKNLFSGSTSIPDPIAGARQTNVSVTSTFTLFQLGYTWAD